MSQTLKRGGKSARRVAAAQGKARQVRAAKARTGSALGQMAAALPFSEDQLHKGMILGILAGALALAWAVASYAGVPAIVGAQFADAAAGAGFKFTRVEVHGVNHLNELKVYERALAQRDQAMPLVDIEAIRDDLLQLSWVEDARVSRRLPDTLVIDIVERTPRAVLKKADRMVLIDATGHELEPISADRAKGMLTVSGAGAGQQVAALGMLLDAAPALKPQVRGAEWVGNRRWNLTFKTGQILALPEGDRDSANALMQFARLDGVNRLLGGKVAAFDMRAPDRIYLRVPGRTDPVESRSAVPASPEAAPAPTGED
jgi:cell division protein FtsQ